MMEMMKEMKTGVFTYNNESYDFNFKTSLSAYEKQLFVKTVVSNIVDDNGYDSIIRNLSILKGDLESGRVLKLADRSPLARNGL